MNWGDFVLTKDQDVRSIHGADGYMVGRVVLRDVQGRFAGLESRRNLKPMNFEHFHTAEEKRQAATILQEMKDLWDQMNTGDRN